MTFDLTNYNQNHRRVELGNKTLHPSLFEVVYEGVSNQYQYEVKDRWVFHQKFIKRKFGKWVPKIFLSIEDGLLGTIHYLQRKKKNTKTFLNQSNEQIENFITSRFLQLQLSNSDFLKTSSQQNSQFVLNQRTSY